MPRPKSAPKTSVTPSPADAAPARKRAASRSAASDETLAPNRQANILQAAERLFATRGFHGVSIRDIADEAGVPLALVGYYYGPKLSLYHAIFRAHAGYIDVRLQSLAQAQQAAPPGQLLEEIVKAFVLPVLEVARQPAGHHFLRLLSRGMNDHLEEDEPIIRELFDPLAHAFIDAIAAALPQATRSQAAWCYQFALGALLHHVNDQRIERLSYGQNQPRDEAAAGPLLVRFVAQGMRGACGGAVH
ncbi:TetR family transcriptional regulator [Acidovorax sp. Root275]|uniref:TetR/AcrR family transcriptional regulator n=1 Tax=Acidovorax sp. Root275 TaxID=1736508 RepID=UPI00070DDEA6|nr:TetR family transcriptional regulator [Acidovorax sp. Root275]KRD41951.1 TetR family transcriptional regulator [Acidovorax sp. Root275]